MSKAEEYIKKYTKRCSNHKELAANITGFEPWLSPYDAEQVAQIAREEVIEKACEWLKENGIGYNYSESSYDHDDGEMINDFKKAMEDKV